jgi:hypothetical protein
LLNHDANLVKLTGLMWDGSTAPTMRVFRPQLRPAPVRHGPSSAGGPTRRIGGTVFRYFERGEFRSPQVRGIGSENRAAAGESWLLDCPEGVRWSSPLEGCRVKQMREKLGSLDHSGPRPREI